MRGLLIGAVCSALLLAGGGNASAATAWQNFPTVDGQLVAAGKNDVYVIGVNQTQIDLSHWDGTSWSPVTLPPLPNGNTDAQANIAASGPNNVLVAGYSWKPGVAGRTPLLDRWNGQAWQTMPVPAGTTELGGVTTEGPNDITLIATPCGTWHWDGTTWKTSAGCERVTELPDGDVWHYLVYQSTVPTCTGLDCPSQPMPCSTTDRDVTDVTGLGGSDVWVLGFGIACHWNGTTWTDLSPGLNDEFYAGTVMPNGTLWAVGAGWPSVGKGHEQALIMRYTAAQGWARRRIASMVSADVYLDGVAWIPGTRNGLMIAGDGVWYRP